MLLADDALVATLTAESSHRLPAAMHFTPQLDDQRRGLAQRTMQAALDREQLVALARLKPLVRRRKVYARAAAEVARTVSPSLWLKLGAWRHMPATSISCAARIWADPSLLCRRWCSSGASAVQRPKRAGGVGLHRLQPRLPRAAGAIAAGGRARGLWWACARLLSQDHDPK